jgi:hypothetical protein
MTIPPPSGEGDREAVEGANLTRRHLRLAPSVTAQRGPAPSPPTG